MLCQPAPVVQFVAETPAPLALVWWDRRSGSAGVNQPGPSQSFARLGDATEGWMDGAMGLPVDGVWLVSFGCGPPRAPRRARPAGRGFVGGADAAGG